MWEDIVDEVAAEVGFSGAVRVDVAGRTEFAKAYGLAHRALRVPNTIDTRFGVASGVKGLTAVTVMSLVEEGRLGLDTTARSLLGSDLPLIDDRVTVGHLLTHRSGIGDYLDEDQLADVNDYPMPVPVHRLLTTEDYLVVLDGHPQQSQPGEHFKYCNGGFVVLALLAERASSTTFHDLVQRRVLDPAGMTESGFFRSDALPARTALHYLDHGPDDRTNVHHLPLRGNGDGGIFTTVADMHRFWMALVAGELLPLDRVAAMTSPVSHVDDSDDSYGYGFWVRDGVSLTALVGYDAGTSFRTVHVRPSATTYTICANTSDGAWPMSHTVEQTLGLRPAAPPT